MESLQENLLGKNNMTNKHRLISENEVNAQR